MLETTIAGSLPKPSWLAKPRMLWAPWQLEGEALVEAKRPLSGRYGDTAAYACGAASPIANSASPL